jgi:hypothetical protein
MHRTVKAPVVATTKGLRDFDRRSSSISPQDNRKSTRTQSGRFWRADGACDRKTGEPVAQQAKRRRVAFARAVTAAEFDLHRGTRLSVSLFTQPILPERRQP